MNEQTKSQPAQGKPAPAASAPAASGEQTKTAAPVAETSGFIADLGDVLATSKSRTTGGSKIRPNVGYTLVADGVKKLIGKNVPEQEQVILKIMNRALTPTKPVISEPELHKLVLAAHASGALKTKQEPWHIFRYYRTDLKKNGVLREVTIEAAA